MTDSVAAEASPKLNGQSAGGLGSDTVSKAADSTATSGADSTLPSTNGKVHDPVDSPMVDDLVPIAIQQYDPNPESPLGPGPVPISELEPVLDASSIEHTISVDAPMSDVREEHEATQKPTDPNTNESASAELKPDSLVGDSDKSAAKAPQSPISPPQERSEPMPDVATKPEAASAPTPPQSTAVSPRPDVNESSSSTQEPPAMSASQEAKQDTTTPIATSESTTDKHERTEDLASSEAKQDTTMPFATNESATIKHERTEDTEDQPSKRPRIDEGNGAASPSVEFEEDKAARKMTPNRQKYSLTVLRQLKRSKDSAPFMVPVDPVKLKIPDYFKIVSNPQDLGTIEAKLKKNEFETIDQFIDAVELVWSNCQRYNGAESPINLMALRLKESFERQIRSMPAADAADATPPAKGSKKLGKKAGSPVATRPRKASTNAPSNSGVPAIRRESMGVDGRPKREIHAPPPKSLPYQNATQKKGKNAKQLKFCGTVLKELMHKKHEQFAYPFYLPVDAVALGLHDYHTIIKKPMDLGTMQQKLNAGEYESADDFEYDMRLMFRNCYKYNGQGTPVNAMGKRLESVFQQKWAEKPLARAAGASDSEDESDVDSTQQQTVEMLTKQLKAMQDKINSMNAPKKSKKPKKSYYDDDDGGMGPRDSDYVQGSSKKGRKGKDDDGEFSESDMYPSYEQKAQLSHKLSGMTEYQMPIVVQILKHTEPDFDPEDDEVELDVEHVKKKTLRLLWNFVIHGQEPSFMRKKPTKSKKGRGMVSESEQMRQIQHLEARLAQIDGKHGADAYGSRYVDKADDSSNDSDASSEEDD